MVSNVLESSRREFSNGLEWSQMVSNVLENFLEKFPQKTSLEKTSLIRFRLKEGGDSAMFYNF